MDHLGFDLFDVHFSWCAKRFAISRKHTCSRKLPLRACQIANSFHQQPKSPSYTVNNLQCPYSLFNGLNHHFTYLEMEVRTVNMPATCAKMDRLHILKAQRQVLRRRKNRNRYGRLQLKHIYIYIYNVGPPR